MDKHITLLNWIPKIVSSYEQKALEKGGKEIKQEIEQGINCVNDGEKKDERKRDCGCNSNGSFGRRSAAVVEE